MKWHLIAHVRVAGGREPITRREIRQVCETRDAALQAFEDWSRREPVGTGWGYWHPQAEGTRNKVTKAIWERDTKGLPWVIHYTVQPDFATEHDRRVLGASF